MDLSALLSGLITDDTVKQVSKKTKTSKKDVTSVLTSALPMLLANGNQTTTQQVAQASGVSQNTTSNILGAAAPMLLGALGGGSGNSGSSSSSGNSGNSGGTGGLNLGMLTSLLGAVDRGKLTSGLMGLISTNTSKEDKDEKPSGSGKKPSGSGKKPASSGKKPSSSAKKPASSGKKPASGKKAESSNPLSAVTGLLGKLFK